MIFGAVIDFLGDFWFCGVSGDFNYLWGCGCWWATGEFGDGIK